VFLGQAHARLQHHCVAGDSVSPCAAFYAGAVFRPHAAGLEPQPHLSAAEAWAEADRRRAGAKKGLRDADPCTGRRRDVSAEDNSSKAWEREFLRQNGGRPLPPSVWRSFRNPQYRVCGSYPAVLTVPAALSDAQILESAGFRCKGRFPALAWVHPVTGAALCRSGQPMAGNHGKSAADEALLGALREVSV